MRMCMHSNHSQDHVCVSDRVQNCKFCSKKQFFQKKLKTPPGVLESLLCETFQNFCIIVGCVGVGGCGWVWVGVCGCVCGLFFKSFFFFLISFLFHKFKKFQK